MLKTYASGEIAARVARDLPKWIYADGCLQRMYHTAGWKGTLMVVNAIGHVCEAAWHHPDLEVSYASIRVKLQTHDAKGITDRDFAVAQKIEELVMWQPAKEGSGLEGPPDDPRYKYIHYDK